MKKNISKNKKIWIIVGMLLVLTLSIVSYQLLKKQNVFDEMYYNGAGATNKSFEKERSYLGKIPNVVRGPQLVSELAEIPDDTITVEKYDKNLLKNNMNNLYVKFQTKEKKLVIHYGYNITDDITIQIDNVYYVKAKKIIRSYYITDSVKKQHVKESKEILNYLKENNITDDDIECMNAYALNDVLLKDWFSVYPSNYSVANLGKVKIETKWKNQKY